MFKKGFAFSALLIGVFAFSSMAYNDYNRGPFQLGVKAGATWSGFWGSGISDFERSLKSSVSKLDPAALPFATGGVFFTYHILPDFLAIQPEVLLARYGKQWDATVGGTTTNFKIFSDYLNIPVLLKVMVPLDLPIVPNAYIGPNLSFKLRSRADNVSALPSTGRGFTADFTGTDIGNLTKAADLGIATGVGFDWNMGPGAIVVDARYNFGLVNAFNSSVPLTDKIKNAAFSIMGGYAIRF